MHNAVYHCPLCRCSANAHRVKYAVLGKCKCFVACVSGRDTSCKHYAFGCFYALGNNANGLSRVVVLHKFWRGAVNWQTARQEKHLLARTGTCSHVIWRGQTVNCALGCRAFSGLDSKRAWGKPNHLRTSGFLLLFLFLLQSRSCKTHLGIP